MGPIGKSTLLNAKKNKSVYKYQSYEVTHIKYICSRNENLLLFLKSVKNKLIHNVNSCLIFLINQKTLKLVPSCVCDQRAFTRVYAHSAPTCQVQNYAWAARRVTIHDNRKWRASRNKRSAAAATSHVLLPPGHELHVLPTPRPIYKRLVFTHGFGRFPTPAPL